MVKKVDIAIVGAGVGGTALYYALSKYVQNVSLLLVDKRSEIANGNSRASNNSQTLHAGEIETNYGYEHALKLRAGSLALRQYCMGLPNREQVISSMPKMVLAVGDKEIDQLEQRYQKFREGFPRLQWFEWKDIREIEPQVAHKNGNRRPDNIAAMGYSESYSAVDYGLLAKSFVQQSQELCAKNSVKGDIWLDAKLIDVQKNSEGYTLSIMKNDVTEKVHCKFLVMASGAYSLHTAHKLGLATEYSLLSAGGNFYFSSLALRGKVYTIQEDGLPFAAVHGDADITQGRRTRFGPTLLPIPKMERYVKGGYRDYWDSIQLKSKFPLTLLALLKNPIIRRYACYDMPLIGKQLFVKQVQKIIPDARPKHLVFAKGFGGSRPLLINHDEGKLIFGETKIKTPLAVFNIAPATGASTCLSVAMNDLQYITQALDLSYDDEAIQLA
jgi:malate dehydrogenase (quinone)